MCKSWTCRKCVSDKYHDPLHPPTKESQEIPEQQGMSNAASSGKQVYLRVISDFATAHEGNRVSALALLDQGSDTSLTLK